MHSALLFYFIIVGDARCDLPWAVKMLIDPLSIVKYSHLCYFPSFSCLNADVPVFSCVHSHQMREHSVSLNHRLALTCKPPVNHSLNCVLIDRVWIVEKWERDRKRQTEKLGILSVMEAKFNSSWCHQSSRAFCLAGKYSHEKKWCRIAQKAHSTSFLLQFASTFQRRRRQVR